MMLATLVGSALIVAMASEPLNDANGAVNLSSQQKNALIAPLVRSATQCVVHAVVADPRYGAKTAVERELGDLIVASMPSCGRAVRAMIDAYDRYYGEGAGKAFFMGPYLDALPQAVVAAGKKAAAP